jgi:hypothetical protein
LSEVELGALLWVLHLAGNNNYRLSLGMGKPLGMGAVKISYQLWLSDRVSRYTSLFRDNLWATGERLAGADEAQKFIEAFESHLLNSIGENYPSLKEMPRIQMLLAMLSWPGVSRNGARYMEIERHVRQPHFGKPKPGDLTVNEYKERPVLPTPLQIVGWEDKRVFEKSQVESSFTPPVKSQSQSKKGNYTCGQFLDAKVLKTQPKGKGMEITYEIQCELEETIKRKEYVKDIGDLLVGQKVKVTITDLKEDGTIRKPR